MMQEKIEEDANWKSDAVNRRKADNTMVNKNDKQ